MNKMKLSYICSFNVLMLKKHGLFFLKILKVDWVFSANIQMFVEGWSFCPYSHNIIIDLWGQVPPFLAWGLWKERNNRVFRDTTRSSKEICLTVKRKIQENLESCSYNQVKKRPTQ